MKNVRLPVSYLLEQCSTHHSLLRQGTIASDNNDNGWSKRWPTRAWLIHHRSCEWSATWRRCTTGYAANQRQSDDPDRPCSTCARRNTCESWRSSDLQTHNINLQLTLYCGSVPRAGSGVVRIDSIHFLAGCRTKRLNQALSVLFHSLDFLSMSAVLLTRAPFCVVLFSFIHSFIHTGKDLRGI